MASRKPDWKRSVPGGRLARNASATGSIARVVAVFEIIIDSSHVEPMKPAMSAAMPPPPTRATTEKAMRRCMPHRSTASPTRKPATKSIDVASKKTFDSSEAEQTPRSGYRTIGSNDVIGRGSTSVTHHNAMTPSTAAPRATSGRPLSTSAGASSIASVTPSTASVCFVAGVDGGV